MAKSRVTYKQEDGDDSYCYVVRVDGKELVNGLTRSEAQYYADQEKKRLGEPTSKPRS